MRLVAFKTAKVHMDGNELYRFIAELLQYNLHTRRTSVIAYARDSCATNATAVNALLTLSVNALNMLCFPHTYLILPNTALY
jgi:hypothetical protein